MELGDSGDALEKTGDSQELQDDKTEEQSETESGADETESLERANEEPVTIKEELTEDDNDDIECVYESGQIVAVDDDDNDEADVQVLSGPITDPTENASGTSEDNTSVSMKRTHPEADENENESASKKIQVHPLCSST